jgi:hypothetical protein
MFYDVYAMNVVLTETREFSEEYTVTNSRGTVLGTILRYDSYVDEVLCVDRFFATPGAVEDGGDDFATFGEALNYLLSENV